jgi:hypothetical protein
MPAASAVRIVPGCSSVRDEGIQQNLVRTKANMPPEDNALKPFSMSKAANMTYRDLNELRNVKVSQIILRPLARWPP